MRKEVIIAIDPDVSKSGVCFLDVRSKDMTVNSLTFPDLLDYFIYVKGKALKAGISVKVVVEAGWLNQSNWHLHTKDTKRSASAKGNAVGRNHETGRKIVECAEHYGLEVVQMKPLRKCWKGANGKITHDELVKITGLKSGRTSQDQRDAALLAWVYAGLPIRMR